ncbi:MAG: hypothetical protein F6K23_34150 [Okeania sp. SIO2C9]|uniref:hypothetical protein n=1 Tax=Okeania sp. SIO2C9 TaxID=2607791 RepID=UPI0013C13C16|nr:hypothetical protein [Okeania sp. SIO2C9]NEQ77616.1 hypothetical protein [Okeania sp. SIO2C9]
MNTYYMRWGDKEMGRWGDGGVGKFNHAIYTLMLIASLMLVISAIFLEELK